MRLGIDIVESAFCTNKHLRQFSNDATYFLCRERPMCDDPIPFVSIIYEDVMRGFCVYKHIIEDDLVCSQYFISFDDLENCIILHNEHGEIIKCQF